jgi:hypothetical protein
MDERLVCAAGLNFEEANKILVETPYETAGFDDNMFDPSMVGEGTGPVGTGAQHIAIAIIREGDEGSDGSGSESEDEGGSDTDSCTSEASDLEAGSAGAEQVRLDERLPVRSLPSHRLVLCPVSRWSSRARAVGAPWALSVAARPRLSKAFR